MPAPVTSITTPDTETVLTSGVDLVGASSGSISVAWSKLNGPGNVTFSAPNSNNTHATFSANGVYILKFTGTNGSGSTFALVMITVFDLMAVPGPNPAINSENP